MLNFMVVRTVYALLMFLVVVPATAYLMGTVGLSFGLSLFLSLVSVGAVISALSHVIARRVSAGGATARERDEVSNIWRYYWVAVLVVGAM